MQGLVGSGTPCISYHIILYHTISYYIIPYHIISQHIISYYIISYHIISYHIISYHLILYHIISYYIILYHTISYYIIPYHIILYHTISQHIIPYHIVSYHTISYYIIPYHIIPSHIISYYIILYHTISYYIIPYHILYHTISQHIIPYHNVSYHTISYIISYHNIPYHIISYHIISYHIIPYHIISYHISYYIISYYIIPYYIIPYHFILYHIIYKPVNLYQFLFELSVSLVLREPTVAFNFVRFIAQYFLLLSQNFSIDWSIKSICLGLLHCIIYLTAFGGYHALFLPPPGVGDFVGVIKQRCVLHLTLAESVVLLVCVGVWCCLECHTLPFCQLVKEERRKFKLQETTMREKKTNKACEVCETVRSIYGNCCKFFYISQDYKVVPAHPSGKGGLEKI